MRTNSSRFFGLLVGCLLPLLSGCGLGPSQDCSLAGSSCGDDSGLNPSPTPVVVEPTVQPTVAPQNDACTVAFDTASAVCTYGLASFSCSSSGSQVLVNSSCNATPVSGVDCAAEAAAAEDACGEDGLAAFSCGAAGATFTCADSGTGGDDDDTTSPDEPQCSDGIDNDSDGETDYPDDTGCTSSSDDSETGGATGSTQCNDGVDNDGDGLIDLDDPGCTSTSDTSEANSSSGDYCQDWDEDGYGNPEVCVPNPTSGYVLDDTDCNDSNANAYPGAPEFCDGDDDNCDGSVDNADWDSDKWVSSDCDEYDGEDSSVLGTGDCSDDPADDYGWIGAGLIHPGQLELGDWVDEDCDGVLDDGCGVLCDSDGDGRENYERDGDDAFECVDGFFVADQSDEEIPLDGFPWTYDTGSSTVSYADIAVSCEASSSTQSNPALWSPRASLIDELCRRTPALTESQCEALVEL